MLAENFNKTISFCGVKLVFEDKAKAEAFQENLYRYFDSKNIYSFTLLIDEMPDVPAQVEYIYRLQFMNCRAYFSSLEQPERQGELLLAELDKYVEISDIPQEFRNSWRNRKVDEEEIPEEYKAQNSRIINSY